MMLRAEAVVPPIVLAEAPVPIPTPWKTLPSATVPVKAVPMRLPSTRLLVAVDCSMSMPSPVLPEIRLPSPGAVPPTVLAGEPT